MEKLNIKKEELEIWKEKIANMIKIEQERKKKREDFNPRLAVIDEKHLTDDDIEIFRKSEEGVWTLGEFQAYTDKVTNEINTNPENKSNNSRDNFRDWIVTKAQLELGKEI